MKNKLILVCLMLALAGCAREPTSSQLRAIADENGALLEELLKLTANEDRVFKISNTEVQLHGGKTYNIHSSEVGRMKHDWKATAQRISDMGAPGAAIWSNPRGAQITFYSYGLTSGGYSKGLMWCKRPPSCVDNLDSLIGKTGRGTFYSKTGSEGWYVFLRIDG